MKMLSIATLTALTLLSSTACAQFQYPQTNGEAMMNVIRRGDTLTITAPDHENLPAAIQQDLLDFAAVVVALPLPVQDTQIKFSKFGPQVSVAKFSNKNGIDDTTPTGVWIWSDWRDAATVTHYPEFSRITFYGNNRYARLEHNEPTSPGRFIRHDFIVDMTDPAQRWVAKGLALLRVAENGRWAGVNRDGQLFVGTLETGNDMAIVENRTPIATPVLVDMSDPSFQESNLLLMPDGSYLVAELDQGQSGHLLILTGDGTQQIAYFPGSLRNRFAVGGNSFYGFTGEIGVDSKMTFFTITPTGQLLIDDASLNTPEWTPSRPAGSSPSGKFSICYRDVPPLGGIQTIMLRTPKANPTEAIPPLTKFDWQAAYAAGPPKPVVTGGWIHWN